MPRMNPSHFAPSLVPSLGRPRGAAARRGCTGSLAALAAPMAVSLALSLTFSGGEARAAAPRPGRVGTVPLGPGRTPPGRKASGRKLKKGPTVPARPKAVTPVPAGGRRGRPAGVLPGTPGAAPRPTKAAPGQPGVITTKASKAGTLNTASDKKIKFDPKGTAGGGDGAAVGADGAVKVEDVIEWKTNFEKGIKCRKIPLNAKIRLDFNEISLSDLTKFISCITEQNFLLSSAAKKTGTISILSPKPVTVYEAYKAYLSALEANNLTVVENGKFLEIVPTKEAKSSGASIRKGPRAPNDDRIVTRLIQLDHVAAEEILPVLDKFKTGSADITVYAPTNTIILTDTGRSIRRLVRLMKELDVPTGKEKIWIRPVQYANASELVQLVQGLLGKGGKSSSHTARPRPKARKTRGKTGPTPSSVVGGGGDMTQIQVTTMLADERTNNIIFVATKTAYLKLDRLLRKLDVPVAGEGQIHIHHLENADATDIASTLSSLASGSRGARGRTKGAKGGKGGAVAGALFEGEVKITAYEPTNSLVIESSRKDYLAMQRVIKQLDIRRKQVYVEAVLMEVSQNKTRDVGITGSGGAIFKAGGDLLPLVFGSGGMPGLTSAISTLGDGGGVAGLQGPNMDIDLGTSADGTSAGTFSIPAFGFLLKAIQTTANVNVLSTPHILTLDNEEAEIQVGRRQPYRNTSFGGLGALSSLAGGLGGNTSALGGLGSLGGLGGLGALGGFGGLGSNVQYVDIDMTLKIKPQVNAADFVRLEIDQSMDELAGFEFDAPVTTKRKVKNVVVVRDGQPVVIGGLIRDAETKSVTKVPFLGDIPLIGVLFRQTHTTTEKRNLLLVVVPHVIKDPSDLKRIHQERQEEYREFAQVMAERQKEFEGRIDYRKKNGLLEQIERKVEQARKERELREAIILESSDVDKVGPPETHDIEYDPRNPGGVSK